MLGGKNLLRDRESAKLAHLFAFAEHGAEGFDVSWVGAPGSLSRLVNVGNGSAVIGFHKVGDCKDPPRLGKRVGNRDLDYTFLFVDRIAEQVFVKKWRGE